MSWWTEVPRDQWKATVAERTFTERSPAVSVPPRRELEFEEEARRRARRRHLQALGFDLLPSTGDDE